MNRRKIIGLAGVVLLLTGGIVWTSLPAINEGMLKYRFYQMGRYYKTHMKQASTFVVNEVQNEQDPNERAFPIAFLPLPEDTEKQEEMKYLCFKIVTTQNVKVRNQYADTFIAGVNAP